MIRVVFFGTPEFAKTILEYLYEQSNVEIAAVVTRPDKPRGRSNKLIASPVKEFALSKNLLICQPAVASDPEFASFLKTLNADFFVVAAYAEILKNNILEIPRYAPLNIHGSILPKYRGAAPVQRALMAGETETGVTIIKMVLQMDAGDILKIAKTPISLEMNTDQLLKILADLGKVAVYQVMQSYLEGAIIPAQQDHSQATFAKKITPEEAEVRWNLPAEAIHNQIRGVNPNPGAWCWTTVKGEKKRLQIKKSWPRKDVQGGCGEILSTKNSELLVGCQTGAVSLLEVQLEGKKALPIEEFLRGIGLDKLQFGS